MSDVYYNALKRESEKETQQSKIEEQKQKEDTAHETDIREERGLSDSEPDRERGAGGNADKVRTDEEELSERTAPRRSSFITGS